MQPLQKELGSPMKINKLWLDVLIPDGPPPDYERSGYDRNFVVEKARD